MVATVASESILASVLVEPRRWCDLSCGQDTDNFATVQFDRVQDLACGAPGYFCHRSLFFHRLPHDHEHYWYPRGFRKPFGPHSQERVRVKSARMDRRGGQPNPEATPTRSTARVDLMLDSSNSL